MFIMVKGVRGAGEGTMDELIWRLAADVTRRFIAYAREKISEDVVGEIVGAIPGVWQFV